MAVAIKTFDEANITQTLNIITQPAGTTVAPGLTLNTAGLVPAPWKFQTLDSGTSDHDHQCVWLYNAAYDNQNDVWSRPVAGEHAVRFGLESRWLPAGDPTVLRGSFEFNIDTDKTLTGAPSWDTRFFFLTYDYDNSRTGLILGHSDDTSDYWSMGQNNNYHFIFARGHPDPDAAIVIGSSPTQAVDKTTVGRLVLTDALATLPDANDKAGFIRMAGTETASLTFDPGLKADASVGNIYLGGVRNTTAYVGNAFAIGNLTTDNSATAGHLRLPYQGTLQMRNQADDGNVSAITVTGVEGNDDVQFGANAYVVGTTPTLGMVAAGTTDDPTLLFARTGPSASIASKIWLDNSAGQLYIDNLYNNDAGNIYIRTKVAGTALNPLTILGSMEIGLNKTAPTAQLHVVSRTTTLPAAILDAADSASVDILRLSKNDSVLSVFDEDGYLGILNTNPSQPLDIAGNALITGLTQLTASANNTVALQVDSAASPAQILVKLRNNTIEAINFDVRDANRQIKLLSVDNGASTGPYVEVQRNSNASTPGAGHVLLETNAGSARYIWPDASGNLRIDTSGPTNANDLGGVVVGTQTSALAEKILHAGQPTPGESLRHLLGAKDALRQFVYKSGAFGGERFFGLVTDFAPRYGMDGGKSLNEVTLFGDIVNAFGAINARLEKLENG